jgi:hypothetical protein
VTQVAIQVSAPLLAAARGGEADGVIDFSAVLTDPANPAKLAAQYDSGDHLHPSSTDHGITR